MAQVEFNSAGIEPAKAFEPVPAGWYTAIITKSEIKVAKTGNQYLNFTFKIQGGAHNNRVIFRMVHLFNTNPIAKEIAEQDMAAICQATGVIQIQDTEQLHGLPMAIKVAITPANGTYEASNDVKGFAAVHEKQAELAVTEQANTGVSAAAAPPPPPAPAQAGNPPPPPPAPAASTPPPPAPTPAPPPPAPAPPPPANPNPAPPPAENTAPPPPPPPPPKPVPPPPAPAPVPEAAAEATPPPPAPEATGQVPDWAQ